MTYRRLLATCGFGLAAIFAPRFLTAASADVATMDEFTLIRDGTTVFDDTFGAGKVLAGGAGAVFPSGLLFPDGSSASYHVIGAVTERGNKAILDTAQGHLIMQPPPFFSAIRLNNTDLLTGPPTGPFSTPFSLTPNVTFAATGLFDLSVPRTPGGFYQLELSDRVASNMGRGDVIAMQVHNCTPSVIECGGKTGAFIQLQNANFGTDTSHTIARVPLVTSNQEILLELTHPTAVSDTVFGSYAYVNGGVVGPLTTIGSYSGLFTGPGTLNYTQAGFTQLTPVPEPSSLTLLASSIPGVLGLVWLRRRKAGGRGSNGETQT